MTFTAIGAWLDASAQINHFALLFWFALTLCVGYALGFLYAIFHG